MTRQSSGAPDTDERAAPASGDGLPLLPHLFSRKAIILAVPDFEPAVGGTTRQVGLQARALARRGHEVVVVTRRLDVRWPRREVVGGITVRRIGPAGRGRVPEKSAVVDLASWLVRNRGKVGVLQPVMWTDAVYAAAAAKLLPVTAVLWAIKGDATIALRPGSSPGRRLQGRIQRELLLRCRHVVLTESMAAELDAVGLHGETSVIPVPVDGTLFRVPAARERQLARHRLGIAGDTFTAIFVGHLQARKGVDLLVEAFGRLLSEGVRDARLLLVGGSRGARDDIEQALRAQVARKGLDRVVTFCGVVAEPRELLWASDVFVLPSFREGMPNSILEAMSCGLPCIAPPSAGGTELITPESGLVPPSNDPGDLVEALRRLARDPAARERMGLAAVERAREYDIERVIGRYEQLYARMTARQSRS